MSSLAEHYLETDRLGEASDLCDELVLRSPELPGEDPIRYYALSTIAEVRSRANRHDEAVQAIDQAIAGVQATQGVAHPVVGGFRRRQLTILRRASRTEEAEALLRAWIEDPALDEAERASLQRALAASESD
jgi:hypothetical protein